MSTARRQGSPVPACVWREFPGHPDLVDLHALRPERYPHLLESSARGTPHARYDILFAFPEQRRVLNGSGLLQSRSPDHTADFLDDLDLEWSKQRIESGSVPDLPFHGGWFLYFGYELARQIEPALHSLPVDIGYPVALAERMPAAIIRDHVQGKTWLVCESGRETLLENMEQDLAISRVRPLGTELPTILHLEEDDPAMHDRQVRKTLDYIRAGDTFQVNLSRAWTISLEAAPIPSDLFTRLRLANPAPFSGLATLGPEQAIVSSSPERLVSVHGRRILTRPIAGTRPRVKEMGNDHQQRAALVTNPKERAEHIMLVDLERNDLGRICVPGSIGVDELLVVESYQHVHHLVSSVSGVLRDEITPGQVIRGLFPGGTITGCPKIRTMQIIAELENEPRRAYTGSMGYLNRDGSLDLNILIRTMQVDGNLVRFRAGGGIVADSDPGRELEETRAKARGLLAVFRRV